MRVQVSKSESSFEEKFEDGIYPGAIIGVRYGMGTNDKGLPRESNCFLLAVSDDENKVVLKKSKEFSCATFNPKGNFAKMVSAMLKIPCTEDDISSALTEMGWMDENGLEMANFLGMPVNVTIKIDISKTDSSKTFANVADLSKSTARVGKIELPKDGGRVPKWFQTPYKGSFKDSELLEGWTWVEGDDSEAAAQPSEAQPSTIQIDEDSIPF